MTKKLLTKKRQKWLKERDRSIVKGQTLNHSLPAQAKYQKALERKLEEMVKIAEREIKSLYSTEYAEKYFSEDASIASQARILVNSLEKKFDRLFKNAADISEMMVSNVDKQSKSSLYQSMKDLSGGLSIKTNIYGADLTNTIKASVAESAMLIKTIPDQYLKNIGGAVFRSIQSGQGLPDVLKEVNKYSNQSKRKIKNLALDQTRKAYNNINRDRMQKVGVKKFEWIHSGGGINPRQDHIDLDGEIFSFDALPIIDKNTGERGIPGQAINCKCTMKPVLEFAED